MNAEDLLAKLEKQELIAPEVIASLRRQIAAATEPIAPATVAKLLVDKKHLTAGQAQRLLEHSGTSQIAKQPAAAATPPATPPATASAIAKVAKPATPSVIQKPSQPAAAKPVPATHNSSVHDDLGLAPLDDLEPLSPPPSAAASAAKSVVKPAAAPATTGAKLDDLGLAPLEELSPVSSPPASAAKSTIQRAAPQKSATQQSAIQKGPAKPAAPAPQTPAASLSELPALDDLGGLTALDELPSLDGLDPIVSDPLSSAGLADLNSPLGATADFGALATQTTAPARPHNSPDTVAAAQESRTTLFVGIAIGGVALLVVVIGLAAFLWPRGDGAKEFQAAEQAYQEKQYPAAIEKYDALLRLHPRHEQASLIRVHRGMSAIHAASGSSPDWSRLLPVLSDSAPPLAAEPAITQIHAELAPLLVQMTEALAEAATTPKVDEQSASRLQQARAALVLCNDSRLLPSNLRPWQKLANVEERLQLLARDIARTATRDHAKATLIQALSAGNITAALQARAQALSTYPELASDELWAELASAFTAAAIKSVKTSADKKPAEREAAKSAILVAQPWQLLNARLQESPPTLSERVVLVPAGGAIHALDASTGQPRWSRYLASSPSERPLVSTDGKLAWLIDRTQTELISVNALTGNLLWRQPCSAKPVGAPLLLDGKIYLTLASGKVQAFDAASGELQAAAELPQAASSGPVATEDGRQLLQLADEGLLYVLNAGDLQCAAAHHLGHEPGAAMFPPLQFQRQIVIAMQRGSEQTEVLAISPEATSTPLKRQRVDGTIGTPLFAAGKRLLISTTQGKLHVLEPGEGNEALKLAQTFPASDTPLLRSLLGTADGIVAADRGLKQFKFDAGGKLQSGWATFSLDLFDSCGLAHDQSLITVRYVNDQDAHFAAAVNTTDGLAIWQTPLQTPLTLLGGEEGSQPVAVSAASIAKLLTLDGMNVDLSAEFKKLLSQPAHHSLQALRLGKFVTIGDEQLLTPPPGSRELVFVKSLDFSVRKLKLPGALAGQPAVCGQNLLVPLGDGAVHSLNSVTGAVTAAPFLLPNVPSSFHSSFTVITLDEAGKDALVTNGVSSLVRIGLIAEPQPHWVEQAAVRLPDSLVSPPMALAEVVFAADRRGQLHLFSLPDLRAGQPLELKGGHVTWGPYRAGDCVLLATDRDELWCCDAARQPRWVQPLAAGQPIGMPRVREKKLIVASAGGHIELRSAVSGEVAASVDLAQPLADSILLSGNTLWLTTTGGQVVQVAIPRESSQP